MCRDELPDCSSQWGLFDAESQCRWPIAELCLKTCKLCAGVRAALQCMSPAGSFIAPPFQHPTVDWRVFFERLEVEHGANVLSRGSPWVVELDRFLTDEEADEVVAAGATEGLRQEDELRDSIRNVSLTNCDSVRCITTPFVSELYRRVSRVLDIPEHNFESLEFLHYNVGQHYVWHRDDFSWKDHQPDPATVLSGPRVLTIFFYLSDVEDGGQTAFAGKPTDRDGSTAKVMVTPTKGKAVLWANMGSDWQLQEPAALHTALPVRAGVKWAASIFVHAAGFRVPEIYAGRECRSH